MMSTTERRIYGACLASYNAGRLHGVWIDTEGKDADELMDEVRERVLLTSPYPNVEVECPDCAGHHTFDELLAGIDRQPGIVVREPHRGLVEVMRLYDRERWYATNRYGAVYRYAADNDLLCCRCKGAGRVPSAEEWAIHDHEGFGGVLGEYDSFDRVAALDRSLEEHGEAFLAFLSAFGNEADPEKFSDAYMGQYDSGKAFAEEYAVETMGLIADDHPLFSYIDFEHYWNADLRHSFTFEDGYVFYSNW